MKAIKTIKFKSFDDFQLQIVNFDQPELVNCLLEAIQRGMEKGNKKVSVCDVEIEDEEDIYEAGLPSIEDRHIADHVSIYALISKNFPSNPKC